MLSTVFAPEAAVFPLVGSVFRSGKLRSVYLHIQPCRQPPVGCKAATLGVVRLQLRTARPIIWEGPAVPLTLPSILILQGCCSYTSMLPCGFNPPPQSSENTLSITLLCVLRPRRSHFYLLSPLTAEGMTACCRKRFVSS